MSNLILCHVKTAEMPYNMAGLGINVYSGEELCYVIAQNAHTLDHDFMDERLCDFADSQLGLTELAGKLRTIIRERGNLADFVMTILEEIGYCDEDEMRSIHQILIESAGLSPARKHKSRGDNLLKARRFSRAIEEYSGTLKKIDVDAEPILYAAVLHNMGTANARLMLYEKAAGFYKDAYALNMDDESLIMYLICTRMYMDKEQYDRMIIRQGYPDRILETVDGIMARRRDYNESSNIYARQLNGLKSLKENGMISRYYEEIDKTIDSWKHEYRSSMIV